jgi:hypothetical protein
MRFPEILPFLTSDSDPIFPKTLDYLTKRIRGLIDNREFLHMTDEMLATIYLQVIALGQSWKRSSVSDSFLLNYFNGVCLDLSHYAICHVRNKLGSGGSLTGIDQHIKKAIEWHTFGCLLNQWEGPFLFDLEENRWVMIEEIHEECFSFNYCQPDLNFLLVCMLQFPSEVIKQPYGKNQYRIILDYPKEESVPGIPNEYVKIGKKGNYRFGMSTKSSVELWKRCPIPISREEETMLELLQEIAKGPMPSLQQVEMVTRSRLFGATIPATWIPWYVKIFTSLEKSVNADDLFSEQRLLAFESLLRLLRFPWLFQFLSFKKLSDEWNSAIQYLNDCVLVFQENQQKWKLSEDFMVSVFIKVVALRQIWNQKVPQQKQWMMDERIYHELSMMARNYVLKHSFSKYFSNKIYRAYYWYYCGWMKDNPWDPLEEEMEWKLLYTLPINEMILDSNTNLPRIDNVQKLFSNELVALINEEEEGEDSLTPHYVCLELPWGSITFPFGKEYEMDEC